MPAASLTDLAAGAAARWSSSYGVTVPRELVLAIIGIESHGDSSAVGAAGELGVMQVKPDTARALGLSDPSLLQDPAVGIYYGTEYLAQQLKRYGGRIPPAVAAYNAGSARYVDNRRETFINQEYVDRVLGRFRQILAGGAPLVGITLAIVGVVAVLALSRRI